MVNTQPLTSFVKDDKAGSVAKNQDDNAMRNNDDAKHRVNLEKSGITGNNAMRNSYAMSKKINCAHCGNSFERRTTWQKYCNVLCKIKSYELRTGKVWKGKKITAASS